MPSPLTGDRAFRDELVRVSELTVTQYEIEGYDFANCQIIGPAVLALGDGITMAHCTFEADMNALFWEVDPATRPLVFGAVGVRKVTFSQCRFQAIGFAGTREMRELMEAGVNE